MYIPTAKGYFTGGGLMEIGTMEAGINVVQSLEIDMEAVNCLKANPKYFSHKIIHEDIKNITVLSQDKTDIIFGAYPCTKYSAIGDIHGVRTGDDLFLHFFRHLAIEKPEMYWMENVPGMKKFKVVMEAMTKLPDYYVHVICPVDALNWLPQRRKRLVIIGTRKNSFIQSPQSERRIQLKDILERTPEIEVPEYVYSRINGNYRDKPIIIDPEQPGAFAPTCVAHYAKDLGTRLIKDKNFKHGVRPFTVREYARLQGIPDDYILENKMSSYRIIGNGVPVPMARWIGEQAMKYFN